MSGLPRRFDYATQKPKASAVQSEQYLAPVTVMFTYWFCLFLFVIIIIILFSATFMMTLANLEGEESFDASQLGHADEVVVDRICDDELILVKGWVKHL